MSLRYFTLGYSGQDRKHDFLYNSNNPRQLNSHNHLHNNLSPPNIHVLVSVVPFVLSLSLPALVDIKLKKKKLNIAITINVTVMEPSVHSGTSINYISNCTLTTSTPELIRTIMRRVITSALAHAASFHGIPSSLSSPQTWRTAEDATSRRSRARPSSQPPWLLNRFLHVTLCPPQHTIRIIFAKLCCAHTRVVALPLPVKSKSSLIYFSFKTTAIGPMWVQRSVQSGLLDFGMIFLL